MRSVIIVLIVVLSAFVPFFAANFIGQKMLPTYENDSHGRRYGYDLMVRFIGVLIFAATVALLGFTYESMR
jgi:hypothetical protein